MSKMDYLTRCAATLRATGGFDFENFDRNGVMIEYRIAPQAEGMIAGERTDDHYAVANDFAAFVHSNREEIGYILGLASS